MKFYHLGYPRCAEKVFVIHMFFNFEVVLRDIIFVMSSGLFFDNKKYLSAKEAAKLTGYSNDYIGQLSRAGKIESRQIGRIWYVSEDSILNYKDSGGLLSVPEISQEIIVKVNNNNLAQKYSKLAVSRLNEIGDSFYFPGYGQFFHEVIFRSNFNFSKKLIPLVLGILFTIGLVSVADQTWSFIQNTSRLTHEAVVTISQSKLSAEISSAPRFIYEALAEVVDLYSGTFARVYQDIGSSMENVANSTIKQTALVAENPPHYILNSMQEFAATTLAKIDKVVEVGGFTVDGEINQLTQKSSQSLVASVFNVSEHTNIETRKQISQNGFSKKSAISVVPDVYANVYDRVMDFASGIASDLPSVEIPVTNHMLMVATEPKTEIIIHPGHYPSPGNRMTDVISEISLSIRESVNNLTKTFVYEPLSMFTRGLMGVEQKFADGIHNAVYSRSSLQLIRLDHTGSDVKDDVKVEKLDIVDNSTRAEVGATPNVLKDVYENTVNAVNRSLQAISSLDFNPSKSTSGEKGISVFTASVLQNTNSSLDTIGVNTYDAVNNIFDVYIYSPIASLFKTSPSKPTIPNVVVVPPPPIVAPEIKITPPPATPPQITPPVVPVKIVERIIQQVPQVVTTESTGVSQIYLDSRLQELNNSIMSKFYSLSSGSGGAITNVYQQIANSQKIDQLSGTAISNPTITSGSISGTSISGSSLAVTGTGTSTFANGIDLADGCFAIDGTCISGGGVGSFDTTVPHTWTALQTFNYSSSTAYSTFDIASSTNLYAGNFTLATSSAGCASFTAAGLLYSTGVTCGSGTGSAVTAVSTSTNETVGQIPYWTTTSGSPAKLGSVGTSTPTIGGSLSYSGTFGNIIGGSSGTLSLNTANANSWSVLQTFNYSSSTAYSSFATASTTNLVINGSSFNNLLGTGLSNSTGALTVSSVPNASLQNSTISGIALGANLADLTATNGTLTFSGTYNGGTARTIGLNLGNANVWTALQQFNANASTTQLSAYSAYFGGTATSTFTTTGFLGLGTTTPQWLLNPFSSSASQLSLSAGAGLAQWAFRNAGGNFYLSTTTVDGTATTSTSVLSITISGNAATTTLASGFSVDNGAILYDIGSGLTSIDNLSLGALSFDTDAGQVSWVDLPVSSSASANTVQSYSAMIDGDPLLTLYSESDGGGTTKNRRLSIGTTTPYANLTVWATTTAGRLFEVVSTASSTIFSIDNTGNVGKVAIASSTPWGLFSVNPNALGTNVPSFVVGSSTATNFIVTGNGNVGIGTTSPYAKLSVAGEIVGSYFTATSTATSTFAGPILANTISSSLSSASGLIFGSTSTPQIFGLDTINNYLQVGIGAGAATPKLFVLDTKNTSGDPTNGVSGAMYYNSNSSLIRCYVGGAWNTCGQATSTKQTTLFNGFTNPDTTGNAWMQPFSINATTTDIFQHMVYIASSTSAKAGFYGTTHIPADYTSTYSAYASIGWTAPLNTGVVVWNFDYRCVGGSDTTSLDQGTFVQSVTKTVNNPTIAQARVVTLLPITTSNCAANDTMEFYLYRDGTNGSDTSVVDAEIHDAVFMYNN